jgi:hypothetical protein
VLFDVGIEDLRMLQYLGSECGERHFVRDFRVAWEFTLWKHVQTPEQNLYVYGTPLRRVGAKTVGNSCSLGDP